MKYIVRNRNSKDNIIIESSKTLNFLYDNLLGRFILKIFICKFISNLIGIYIAIIFLKRPLLISTTILGYITKVFKVLVIYSIARLLLAPESSPPPISAALSRAAAKVIPVLRCFFKFCL